MSAPKILPSGKITGAKKDDTYRVLSGDTIGDLQDQMNALSKQGWRPAVGSISFQYSGARGGPNKLRLYIIMTNLTTPVNVTAPPARK